MLGTVPAGQTPPIGLPEAEPGPLGVLGGFPVGAAGVIPFGFPAAELVCELALGEEAEPVFAGGVVGTVPFTGTQVMAAGALGDAVCGVPFVAGDALFCVVVPGAGAWGVVEAFGPAALVVIGVGGPMVVGGGVMLGLVGGVVLAGGGTLGVDV